MSSRLERIAQQQAAVDEATDLSAFEFEQKECPTLLEMMGTEAVNGEKRKRTTVTVYVEAGAVGWCVSDRDANLQLHGRVDSVEALWSDIEAVLVSGAAKWRKTRTQRHGAWEKKS